MRRPRGAWGTAGWDGVGAGLEARRGTGVVSAVGSVCGAGEGDAEFEAVLAVSGAGC